MEINTKDKDDVYSNVYVKMLNFLSFRKRSEFEILDRLKKYIHKSRLPLREKSEISEKIIITLKNDGYLKVNNDAIFSSYYIETLKNSGKPFNRLRVSKFLSSKRIPKDVIESVLKDVDTDSIRDSVLRDAEKKLRNLKDSDKYSKKRKLLNYLYRKGYPFDVVSSVVDTLTQLQ